MASLRVKPIMATIMNSAPRRFGERGKGVTGFAKAVPGKV
jgi:hypothetical protein